MGSSIRSYPLSFDSRRPEPQRDPLYCAKLLGKVRAGLAHIEANLAGRRFIHGEGLSLADIAVVAMTGYLKLRQPALLEDAYPELQRYLGEQLQRKSFADTIPPNLPVRA